MREDGNGVSLRLPYSKGEERSAAANAPPYG